MQVQNQLANAAEDSGGEENLSPELMSTISNYMDEQLRLAHEVIDVVDGANRIFCCLTM